MAQIDIQNCRVYLCDGRKATLTNQGITYTDATTHRGLRPLPRIVLIDPPGNNVPLSATVTDDETGTVVTVTLATDGSSAVTTTATQLVAFLQANEAVKSIVTVSGSGGTPLAPLASTSLTNGPRKLELIIGEGDVTFSSKKPRIFTLNRGILNSVRNGPQEPMDVTFNAEWHTTKALNSDTSPTLHEVIHQIGHASTWVTTSDDPCSPYCLDVWIANILPCGDVPDEVICFEQMYFETENGSLSNGSFDISGRCNSQTFIAYRQEDVVLN